MEVSDYIEYVASEGEMFAYVAEAGDLAADVPSCPGWDMRDLVRHLAFIHLWAAGHVAFPHPPPDSNEELEDLVGFWPDLAASWPDDADLVSWYRATLANLIRVLKEAPADVDSFTFLPCSSPLAMWARRQASEIAMHRFDAEHARGITSHFEPKFAADVLDEMLYGFAPRPRKLRVPTNQVMHVHSTDTNGDWYLNIGADRIEIAPEGTDADLTLEGTAADLYLKLWNRTPNSDITMTGNAELMDQWHGGVLIRW